MNSIIITVSSSVSNSKMIVFLNEWLASSAKVRKKVFIILRVERRFEKKRKKTRWLPSSFHWIRYATPEVDRIDGDSWLVREGANGDGLGTRLRHYFHPALFLAFFFPFFFLCCPPIRRALYHRRRRRFFFFATRFIGRRSRRAPVLPSFTEFYRVFYVPRWVASFDLFSDMK